MFYILCILISLKGAEKKVQTIKTKRMKELFGLTSSDNYLVSSKVRINDNRF